MSTVERAALEGARVKRGLGRARNRAIEARRIERVLSRREKGWRVDRIATDLKAGVEAVKLILAHARHAGDPRALNERQAIARARAIAAEEAGPVPAFIPVSLPEPAPAVEPPAVEPEPVVRPDIPTSEELPGLLERLGRTAFVERLREIAEHYSLSDPLGCAGLLHLADLHAYHAGFYPTVSVPSGGFATLADTERRFPRASDPASMSSPAYACTVD